MTSSRIAFLRLAAQQIARHDFTRPRDVVAWLGAVQAQDWAGTKWAVGLRMVEGAATDETIEHAVDEGSIVRIHAMRWTWQLVAPEDVRWMLALVAPRLRARAARRHRELGIDGPSMKRSLDAIARALEGGRHLTRAELARVLERARISPAGGRLSHLLALAELDALVCSGARRGKQATWALLDERVRASRSRDRGDALRDLARVYFRSRGPATHADFRWWSGLDTADARAAIASARDDLSHETLDGHVYYGHPSASAARTPGTHLLPPFDEYLVAYRDRDAVLDPREVRRLNAGGGMLGACVVHRGQVVGTWRRTVAPGSRRRGKQVAVEHDLFAPRAVPSRALALATRRYVAFLGA